MLLPGVGALALTKQHDQLVSAGGDGCALLPVSKHTTCGFCKAES